MPASKEDRDSLVLTDRDIRCFSLLAAILHHGLSNLATGVIPPRTETIMHTAQSFEPYVKDGTVPTTQTRRKP